MLLRGENVQLPRWQKVNKKQSLKPTKTCENVSVKLKTLRRMIRKKEFSLCEREIKLVEGL